MPARLYIYEARPPPYLDTLPTHHHTHYTQQQQPHNTWKAVPTGLVSLSVHHITSSYLEGKISPSPSHSHFSPRTAIVNMADTVTSPQPSETMGNVDQPKESDPIDMTLPIITLSVLGVVFLLI